MDVDIETTIIPLTSVNISEANLIEDTPPLFLITEASDWSNIVETSTAAIEINIGIAMCNICFKYGSCQSILKECLYPSFLTK